MIGEEQRLERLEDRLGSVEVAMAHGFGEIRQDVSHLRELLSNTLGRSPATPVWLLLLASGTFLLGLACVVLVVGQLIVS